MYQANTNIPVLVKRGVDFYCIMGGGEHYRYISETTKFPAFDSPHALRRNSLPEPATEAEFKMMYPHLTKFARLSCLDWTLANNPDLIWRYTNDRPLRTWEGMLIYNWHTFTDKEPNIGDYIAMKWEDGSNLSLIHI